MGDKKDKEKGGTWNRLMSMKMLGGKASTGTARAAKESEGDINKRRSANISGGATVAGADRDPRSRPGLGDLFKPPEPTPAAAPSQGESFPGIRVNVVDSSGDEKVRARKRAEEKADAARALAEKQMREEEKEANAKMSSSERSKTDRSKERQAFKESGYRQSDPNLFNVSDEEIRRREHALSEREAALAAREKQLANMQESNSKQNHLDKLDLVLTKLDRLDRLDKLDKLDALFAKLNSMPMGAPIAGAGASNGKTADQLKKEIEDLQKVIFDPKSSDKEVSDANIKLEKVMQEFENTPEFRAEVMKQKEERRKRNEPLNKAALDKMKGLYSTDNVKKDPKLLQRLTENSELRLIFLDQEAILKMHQNDFKNYTLRQLDLEELRAVRGALPNFRRDQRIQLDWADGLDEKIEVAAKSGGEVKKPPPGPIPSVSSKTWRAPPASKAVAHPGGIFGELLAKRSAADGEVGTPPGTLTPTTASRASAPGAPASNPQLLAVAASGPSRSSTGGPALPPPGPPKLPPKSGATTTAPSSSSAAPKSAVAEVDKILASLAKLNDINRAEGDIAKDTRNAVQEIKVYTQMLSAAAWRVEKGTQLESAASKLVLAIKAVLVAKKSGGDLTKSQAELQDLIKEVRALAQATLV